jgi:CO dehydrogenase/acetyl-CoA synthase alpha subunit
MNPLVQSKEGKRIADAGFTSLEYAGIPVVFDPKCPAGTMFFLNTENSKLYVHKDAFMDKTPKLSPVDQHVTVQHIVVRATFGTNRRKSLGALRNKTA